MKRTTLKKAGAATKKAPTTKLVHLEFFDPKAHAVFVAGSFNDWHPAATEMFSPSPGRWVKEMTLPPGEHEYRLVVDGVWMTDPSCPRRATNPFGSENSVLSVQS